MPKPPRQLLQPTRQRSEPYPSNLALVEAAFITLRSGLEGYKILNEINPEDTTLTEYDQYRRRGHYTALGILVVKNGFVLHKVTQSTLADYAQRLTVPTDASPPNYYGGWFNEDIQCIPPKDINISGEVEISRNSEAVIGVLSFERDVVYGALSNWEYNVVKYNSVAGTDS